MKLGMVVYWINLQGGNSVTTQNNYRYKIWADFSKNFPGNCGQLIAHQFRIPTRVKHTLNVLTLYLHAQGVFAVCMFHEKWTRAHNVIRVHIYSPYIFSPFPEVIKGFPLSVSTLVIRQLVRRDFFVFEEFMKYWTQLPLVRCSTATFCVTHWYASVHHIRVLMDRISA